MADNGGVGDRVSEFLESFGVTKERASALAARFGVRDCGCQQRQERLNEIGRQWLGIGTTGPTPSA